MKKIVFYGTFKITCYVVRSEASLPLYSNVRRFIKMTFRDLFMSSAFIEISLITRMNSIKWAEKKDFVLSH